MTHTLDLGKLTNRAEKKACWLVVICAILGLDAGNQ